MEFAVSFFRLQQKNRSCPFPLVMFHICGTPETWRQGDKETWRHTHETWTWKQGHGDLDMEFLENQTENESPGDFPLSVSHLLIVQMEFVVCPFVDEKKNRLNLPIYNNFAYMYRQLCNEITVG
jgi:hypothetical protein